MTDAAEIARGLSKAQREALLNARVVVPFCHGEPWPEGVAQFLSTSWDQLTPLGLSVAAHLKDKDKENDHG